MKKAVGLLVTAGLLSAFAMGCAYGGVAVAGDKVVVLRNDGFLFGALRRVYVCKVTDAGLANCNRNDDP